MVVLFVAVVCFSSLFCLRARVGETPKSQVTSSKVEGGVADERRLCKWEIPLVAVH